MRHVAVYCLLAFMLVLAACPMKTDEPIDNGSYEVPSWMLGKWSTYTMIFGIEDDKPTTISIEKSSAKGQFIVYFVDSLGNVDTVATPVIMSKIKGVVYLSVFNNPGYYLYEFGMRSDNEVYISEIKDNLIKKSATSKEIQKFLASSKNQNIATGVQTWKKN